MAGHVFVVRSDLTRLRCDAWLLPTDYGFSVTDSWPLPDTTRTQVDDLHSGRTLPPAGWGSAVRAVPLLGDHWDDSVPILADVGAEPGMPAAWYADGARQFLNAGAGATRANRIGRQRPLLALPLVGTGAGGAAEDKGEVVRALVAALHEEAARLDVDVALVVNSDAAFVATQNARRAYFAGNPGAAWPDLDRELRPEARRLAALATAERLVLFVGAGVGQAAGLPGWNQLLARLASDAGLPKATQDELRNMPELDQPRIIGRKLAEQGRSLGQAVAALVDADRFSLAHALLAALPVAEVVTTNYDTLFEAASDASGRPAAVLPYQPVSGHDRWLLKLHGSVTHPEDIVLSREDYIRYGDRRAALGAIVQALLITRHMLFVGFSLRDDNFHRILDDVRKVIRTPDVRRDGHADPPAAFGSALLLRRNSLLEDLYRDDLRLVGVAGDAGAVGDGAAARRLEIFLDCLLADASQGVSPLLDPAYDAVLTDEERQIRRLLRRLEDGASADVRASSAWRPIERLLRRLGGESAQPSGGDTGGGDRALGH